MDEYGCALIVIGVPIVCSALKLEGWSAVAALAVIALAVMVCRWMELAPFRRCSKTREDEA